MRILFVGDDLAFRDELTRYLLANGLEVDVFADMAALRDSLSHDAMRLILLDMKPGDQSGLGFLRDTALRNGYPCIILDNSPDAMDRIITLESGADDVIAKTAQLREILARVRAVMRRSGASLHIDQGWRFMPERRTLLRPDGSVVPLTTAEFNLLEVLVQNQGRPVARDALFGVVFGRAFNPLDRAIDNLVAKLRAKLGSPEMIRTVRPVGYAFTGFPPPE